MNFIGEIAGLAASFFFAMTAIIFTRTGRMVGSQVTNRMRLLFCIDISGHFEPYSLRRATAILAIRDKLLEHKEYISKYGEDMPEITDWQWGRRAPSKRRGGSTEADNV